MYAIAAEFLAKIRLVIYIEASLSSTPVAVATIHSKVVFPLL